jgi:hypothetical protein
MGRRRKIPSTVLEAGGMSGSDVYCRLELGRLCGNRLPLEFRHTYTPATDSIPPRSSHHRKEDL